MQNNSLIRKKRLIPKFLTSDSGKQTIAIHILPNISRSKGNQTMKFVHKKYFFEKSNTKCGRETITRPFFKKSKIGLSLDH